MSARPRTRVDRPMDRAHPRKRLRPIAAGQLAVAPALAVAVLLVAGGVTVAVWGGGLRVAAVVVAYVSLALAYTLMLRDIVLLDLAAVAGGFVLRAAAGGVAVRVPLSSWFLIVACFWAFEGASGRSLAAALSILPLVLGVYRYAMLLDAGRGGAPEDVVLRDRPLQLCGLLWILLVAIGV